MKKEVVLKQTIGNVFIQSNGKKRKVETVPPKNVEEIDDYKEIPIKDGDVIITEKNSYAIDIGDKNTSHYTYVSLFPNSKVKLNIKGATITKVILMNGLFRVHTYGPIEMPLAEIDYLVESDHFFWIHVKKGERVSIAIVSGYAEISHKQLDKSVKIQMNQQVTLTPSSMSDEPEEVDQKFKDAYKKQREFESNYWAFTDDMSEQIEGGYVEFMQNHIVELEKQIKEIEEEGDFVPKMLRTQLEQAKRELKKAKQEIKENKAYRKQKKKAEKEATEFQKKFDEKQAQFDKELNQMAQEVSTKEQSSENQGGEEMSELDKQIQSAGSELDASGSKTSETSDEDEISDLEKQIQAAGDELNSGNSESTDGEEEEELTELEKKIRDAG